VPLPRTAAEPALTFEVKADLSEAPELVEHQPVYVEGRRADGRPDFEFYTLGDHDIIRITGAMDFHCRPDRIVCELYEPRHRYLIEVALFGMVMSLWLERMGSVTLHASSVAIGDRAVGFLSHQGGGKTSTTAAFLAAGHSLLSDDLLAIQEKDGQPIAQPGYPQLRLWPEQARYFLGSEEGQPTFHPAHDKRRVTVGEGFGSFAGKAVPLARLYLPERMVEADARVVITRLRARDAVMALVTHSFLTREVVRFGLQRSRLALFARLLATVGVFRLAVPQGLEELPRVVAAIEADVRE
jgi:hypothetical protein